MKQRILTTIIALAAAVGSAMGQTLRVEPVEAEAGTRAEVVVSLDNTEARTTALQFNLHLPEGITLDETAITQGEAASGHTLDIRPLEGGDRLFVLYNMDMALLTDGTLLRLPITLPTEAGTQTGTLSLFRTATTDAVSHTGEGVGIEIKALQRGDVNADDQVSIADVISLVNIILGKDARKSVADVNRDGQVSITDVTALVNLILEKRL